MAYDYKSIEEKWVSKWEEEKTYKFDENSKKPVYSIDSPPPFTSGKLHMGHILSYSYFDFMARFKRMTGYNVFFPQGWDSQGFPTEVKVEAKYGKLPRDEFVRKCREWTTEYIKIMRTQMKKMGFSPDWDYEYITMSEDYHRKVQYSVLKMYELGHVYRGKHPVIWCPTCKSAIAKAETEEQEKQGMLYYIDFELDSKPITIATTRPELLHGVVAVLANPDDERYKKYNGKTVKVPIFGQEVPLYFDSEVKPDFGTGLVMVATFGDSTDIKWMYKFQLPLIESISQEGTLINAGEFTGMKTSEAKKAIVTKLKELGLLRKEEPLQQIIKIHDRCKQPIEYISNMEWFMRTKDHKEKIIELAKTMEWVPEFTISHLIDWAQNQEWDWVISRDRIWGTPIPFWYCDKCGKIYPAKYEDLPVDPALTPYGKKCECGGNIVGETKVLDVWVDSSITPLAAAGWPDNDELVSKAYPASLRPQGYEIIRTWAFYTIYRSSVLTGKAPFKTLLLNGNVLGPDGRKMSKSLGNVVAPEDLMLDYAADALRQWAAGSGALAKDRPFRYADAKRGQAFLNKMWNAYKFIDRNLQDYNTRTTLDDVNLRTIDKAVLSKLNRLIKSTREWYDKFDFFKVISEMQHFFWSEFCDFYLEEVKYRLYGDVSPESKLAAQYTLYTTLIASLKILAPIMPFITEEIYRQYHNSSIHLSNYPEYTANLIDEDSEKAWGLANTIISEVRKFKAQNQMSLKVRLPAITVWLPPEKMAYIDSVIEDIKETAKVDSVVVNEGKPPGHDCEICVFPEV